MSFWRHTLLAPATLALGALLSGCELAVYKEQPVANDPKAVPWDHERVADPPTVGNPMYYWPAGNGLQYLDGQGNGLH